jgi:predicted Zn-dependent protease
MEYENPRIPEGINVTPEHPLKEFLQLTVGAVVLVAAVVGVLAFGIGQVARLVPFEMEQRLAGPYLGPLADESAAETMLRDLAARLLAVHPLPDGMTVEVHLVDSDTVNAMATIGGQVLIFRGLLEKVPHENALAMVLAHEIAHVRHRDPIVGLGRGVVIGLALAALSGMSGNDIVGRALGSSGILTLLSFTRDQERAADEDALEAVAALYGHTAGADQFFRTLLQLPEEKARDSLPQFLSTHPLTGKRIDDMRRHAVARGLATEGATTPLNMGSE